MKQKSIWLIILLSLSTFASAATTQSVVDKINQLPAGSDSVEKACNMALKRAQAVLRENSLGAPAGSVFGGTLTGIGSSLQEGLNEIEQGLQSPEVQAALEEAKEAGEKVVDWSKERAEEMAQSDLAGVVDEYNPYSVLTEKSESEPLQSDNYDDLEYEMSGNSYRDNYQPRGRQEAMEQIPEDLRPKAYQPTPTPTPTPTPAPTVNPSPSPPVVPTAPATGGATPSTPTPDDAQLIADATSQIVSELELLQDAISSFRRVGVFALSPNRANKAHKTLGQIIDDFNAFNGDRTAFQAQIAQSLKALQGV